MPGALQSGSEISHYRVISPLGAGGMGEVYVAQDTTLERAVALKVLPPDLVRNEERVRRFIQEAKSASSLSHPNIITIYEIGRAGVRPESGAAGASAEGPPIHFIAMELITGETLKHKIHEERSDLRVLLRYLTQAAEGLAKAHAAGIVHRDLKPENIMISRDGYAKVLDFGLAKLTERQEIGAAEVTSAPTKAEERTREGAVLGTVNYMSPEQVQGRSADHRSDIFSFGCILYEAATGRKPFAADSDVETMHRILRDTPASIDQLNPRAPAVLRRLVRRCLDKSPERRLQSMKDLAIELGEIVDEYDQLSASTDSDGSAPAGVAAQANAGRRREVMLTVGIVAAVAVGLAGIAVGLYGLRQRAASVASAPESFQSMRMTRLTTQGNVARAALSPDGKYLAGVSEDAGRTSLWVRQVATGSEVQVLPPQELPFRGVGLSPDGNYLYYVRQETGGPGYSALFQMPVLGGAPRRLVFDVDSGVTFSPDASRIAFARGYPEQAESVLLAAGADGTGEERLAILKAPESFSFTAPSWSPDGRFLAAVVRSTQGGLHEEIALIEVAGGKRVILGSRRWIDISGVAWLPDGSGLALTATEPQTFGTNQVWILEYPGGRARRVTNDLNGYDGLSLTADSRALATVQSNQIANLWAAPASDPRAPRQLTFGSGREDAVVDFSPGAGGVVNFSAAQAGRGDIWALGPDGKSRSRLTSQGIRNGRPRTSRNGRVIAFTSIREDGLPHVWVMDPDGTNQRQVTKGSGEQLLSVSPDGAFVLHSSLAGPGVYKTPIVSGEPVRILESGLSSAEFSPDGRQVAVEIFEKGVDRLERVLEVIPAAGGAPIKRFPFPDGLSPRWSPSGNALVWIREAAGAGNLVQQPLDGGPARPITEFTSGRIFAFDWSLDGKTLYLSRGETPRDVVLITGFK